MRLAWIVVAFSMLAAAAPAVPDPTVDRIVNDYIAARGGLAKIRSVQSLRQRGHAFADAGREAIVLRELKRPGKTRFEFTVQGVTGVYVVDGAKGWQVSPFDGDMKPEPMAEQAVTEAMEQPDIEGPLVDWKAKGHRVELAGHETVGGRDTFKLKLVLKSGAVRYEYIDTKTHYELRTDSTRLIRGRDVPFVTTFGDHKKSDGVLFPRTLEMSTEGRPGRLRVVVDSVEVNPSLGDDRFRRPKSLD
jgi:hypothetical protein